MTGTRLSQTSKCRGTVPYVPTTPPAAESSSPRLNMQAIINCSALWPPTPQRFQTSQLDVGANSGPQHIRNVRSGPEMRSPAHLCGLARWWNYPSLSSPVGKFARPATQHAVVIQLSIPSASCSVTSRTRPRLQCLCLPTRERQHPLYTDPVSRDDRVEYHLRQYQPARLPAGTGWLVYI